MPPSKTALNAISDHFPTWGVSSSVYHEVMVSRIFIFDPKIVQKGNREKTVPGFYTASTWDRN